jgi:hypothetical protein
MTKRERRYHNLQQFCKRLHIATIKLKVVNDRMFKDFITYGIVADPYWHKGLPTGTIKISKT